MTQDFKISAGQVRYSQLEYLRQQQQAELTRCEIEGDYEGAANAEEIILEAEDRQAKLVAGGQRHVAALNPPAPSPLSPEEQAAKPIDKMTWADAYSMASKSKHGVDNAAFARGMQEVMARRQRGE